jgi:hypothetical protein
LGNQNQKIDAYINKQQSPQKEICQKLREIIHKTLPDVKEEMKWGVPTFAGGKFYFVALKDHVNLGFSIAGLSEEEVARLQGSGETMKVLEIADVKDVDEARIVELLELVFSKQ